MRAYERLLKYVTVRTPSMRQALPYRLLPASLTGTGSDPGVHQFGTTKGNGRMKNAMSTHRFLPRRDMKIVRRSDLLHIWILFLTSVTRRSFRL